MAKKTKRKGKTGKQRSHFQKSPKQYQQLRQAYLQLYHQKRYQEALKTALQAHRHAPTSPAPLTDAATCAVYLEQWEKVIELSKKVLMLDSQHLNSLDGLAHAYGALSQWEACRHYGNQALMQRDQRYGRLSNPPPPPTVDKARADKGKKIIAFSLYGNHSTYNEAAVLNAEVCPRVFPDWQCRFYVDDSVSLPLIERLKALGAEVIFVDERLKRWAGTMWRFSALDDPNVGYVLFRDADSVISVREAEAVDAWLASDKAFHLMRDSGSHTEIILAGLWGAVSGALPDLSAMIDAYMQAHGDPDNRFADQYFLRENIWAVMRQSVLQHDSRFGFMDSVDFPSANVAGYAKTHIGINECRTQFHANWDNLPDKTPVYWSLYTQYDSFIDLENQQLEGEERHICTYQTFVENNRVSGHIPQRFYYGLDTGKTRIAFSTTPPQHPVMNAEPLNS